MIVFPDRRRDCFMSFDLILALLALLPLLATTPARMIQ
jgi:hypothetical protein